MTGPAIETTDLTKHFGKVIAVDGVDLSVPRGSVYGYLGRNGAGKTTTIQMLMGFLQPTKGEATVLDFDPLRDEVAMKTVVSYVPEQVQMYDWMTVQGTMWFGENTHPRWDQDLAEDLLKRFELPPDRRLGQLSRGMLGKVALTFALAPHPELLILDDPTSGLDALVRREFVESIVGILQEAGTTVFFSSHIIDDVERVADWVGILHEGTLIVQEPLEDLKESVRRIVVNTPEDWQPPEQDKILHTEGEGRRRSIIVRDFVASDVEHLRESGASDIEVEDLSLEDIFIAHVRTVPTGSVTEQ